MKVKQFYRFFTQLVGQKIPGKGIALSGQENRYFGKDFQEVAHYQKAVGGLQGEITMVQMYKIALTAGKAYTDHRHHHSHYTSTTPEPPEEPTEGNCNNYDLSNTKKCMSN